MLNLLESFSPFSFPNSLSSPLFNSSANMAIHILLALSSKDYLKWILLTITIEAYVLLLVLLHKDSFQEEAVFLLNTATCTSAFSPDLADFPNMILYALQLVASIIGDSRQQLLHS